MNSDRESIHDEPWMKPPPLGRTGPPDSHAVAESYNVPPSLEEGGAQELYTPASLTVEKILHSVHSEPEHADSPLATQLDSLIGHRRKVSTPESIAFILLVTLLVSGPVAVAGTFLGAQPGYMGSIYLCVVGPVVEEMMKIAVVLFLLEKRPWYILNRETIYVVAVVSGAMFGVIENLIYEYVYLQRLAPGARASIMEFRWMVTVALHAGTSFVAALGLSRAWMFTIGRGKLFDSNIAEPFIAVAIVIHGLYNLFALLGFNYFFR